MRQMASWRRLAIGSAGWLLLSVLLPATAAPCSICRCGDPTFNALGKDGWTVQGWRFALDAERFDKEEGDLAADGESQVENRVTANASYGLSEVVSLFARVPLSVRRLESRDAAGAVDSLHTTGLSDPELYGQLRLWASRFGPKVGRRTTVSLLAGVKTPWGQNDLSRGGVRLEEHAQPGTGSTDVFGSLAFLYIVDRQSALFASVGYRDTGTNAHDYRYGRALLGNLAYEHKLGGRVDGAVELNFRDAARDVVDASGATGPDTGGWLVYLTPRLLVNAGSGVVLRVAVQVPVARGLNGVQHERAVVNAGFTCLFGGR